MWISAETPDFNLGATQTHYLGCPYQKGLTSPALTNKVLADYAADKHEDDVVYTQSSEYRVELGPARQNNPATIDIDLSQVWTRPRYYRRLQSGNFDLMQFEGHADLTGGGMSGSCPNQPAAVTRMIQNARSPSPAGPLGDSIVVEFDNSLSIAAEGGNNGNGGPRTPRPGKSNAVYFSRNTPSSDFDSPEECLVGDTHSPVSNTPHDAAKALTSVSDAALLKVNYALRICIRADYVEFLETNLPRWVRDGIWRTVWFPNEAKGADGYESLQKAYWNVCLLDRQMGDDAIRSRMAMVLLHLEYEKACRTWKNRTATCEKPATGVGRGGISCLIDNIIKNTYPEWAAASSEEKSEMRAKFHDRKRKNTAVTAKMIKEIERAIQNSKTGLIDILNLVNPIAQSLFLNRGYGSHNVQKVLKSLRATHVRTAADDKSV
ncbi:hypothetical protein MANI_004803 [Metarhizium anisopliae]|nr:hypothetical protein MANI_004803 [Metarhizium anisopliae]